MKFNLLLISFLILTASATGQSSLKHTIKGYLRDVTSNENLVGASVIVSELGSGTVTNVYGFYSVTLPEGEYTINYSYVGYKSISVKIDLKKDVTKNINLELNQEVLKEVVITAEQNDANVTSVEMSVERIDIQTIKKIPQLLGEADVIKSLQLRPGVSSVGEGASGFNVRGGNIDQNLILLDESPVYNSSHLFGFFSVFNPDAVKEVTLYKGGIPARYGGRLSSVMDVRQREGNSRQFSGQGGIGVLFSRLTLEGPIIKDKMSFLISGRRSYADLFLRLTEDFRDNQAYFYDLNTKVNYTINDRNRIFLSGYFGRDIFGFGDDFRVEWGNFTGSVRWNHLVNDKLFMNITGVYSDYQYNLGIPSGSQAFDFRAKILTTEFKVDFTHYLNPKNKLEYGLDLHFFDFLPGEARGLGDETIFSEVKVPAEYTVMPAIYLSNEQKVGDRITLQYGLRYAIFYNIGPLDVNLYRYGVPTQQSDIIGVARYGEAEINAQYDGLEPRFAANYLIDKKQSVKVSYMRTRQYMQLVSNTTAATPFDIWKPAGYYIKPATADQFAVGYFRNFKGNMWEFSAETYYKVLQNVLEYRDGAELILNEHLETELLQGDGRAYGLELMLSKTAGRITGWVSYTLSRSELKVDGFQVADYYGAQNGVNKGEWYPSNWDKTHDLSVVAQYDLTTQWVISGTFIYVTGRPATYPSGAYVWDNITVPLYDSRNQNRIPHTHRLDLSATWTPVRQGKRWKSSLSFGIYNVYGRKNPYSVFFRQDPDNPGRTQSMRLAIVGIPVPFITYNFKF